LSDKTPAEAQRIINKWVRNDVLVSEEYFNEERHEKEHGLRVNPGKRP